MFCVNSPHPTLSQRARASEQIDYSYLSPFSPWEKAGYEGCLHKILYTLIRVFSSQLGKLKKQYEEELKTLKAAGQTPEKRNDWSALYGEFSVGQNDFDTAFFVAVEEIKKRAALLGADAFVGTSQDIDLDTQGSTYFYLQMCGTAVRFV